MSGGLERIWLIFVLASPAPLPKKSKSSADAEQVHLLFKQCARERAGVFLSGRGLCPGGGADRMGVVISALVERDAFVGESELARGGRRRAALWCLFAALADAPCDGREGRREG